MKKYILIFLSIPTAIISCQSKDQTTAATSSSLQLPYEAAYSTEFNNNVSDSALLTVLNSYKYWETGDEKAFRATLADSISINLPNGFKYNGPSDSVMKDWQNERDSLSSVKITMEVWLKNHDLKNKNNFINVWYKEIDTFKSGKVDSANYEDDNMVNKDGKIIWLSSHKQKLNKG